MDSKKEKQIVKNDDNELKKLCEFYEKYPNAGKVPIIDKELYYYVGRPPAVRYKSLTFPPYH